MDLAQLRAVDADAVRDLARDLRQHSAELADLGDSLHAKVRQPLRHEWHGRAAEAADERISTTAKQVVTQVEQLGTAESELRRFAEVVDSAQDLVKQADQLAARSGLSIASDGSVDLPDGLFFSDDPGREALLQSGREVADLLQRAVNIASSADEACDRGLAPFDLVERWPGQGQGDGAGGGDGDGGFWDRAGDLVGDAFGMDFENSPVGEAWGDFTEGDRSVFERVFVDPDGPLDIFGDLNEADEHVVSETIGGTPDEIFGEEVVDRVHDEGLASLPDAMWDDFYEGVTDIDDRISDGWDDFTDDPVGSVGRAFGIG